MDTGVITNLQIVDKEYEDSLEVDVRINGIHDAKNATITFKTLELMERDFNISSLISRKENFG